MDSFLKQRKRFLAVAPLGEGNGMLETGHCVGSGSGILRWRLSCRSGGHEQPNHSANAKTGDLIHHLIVHREVVAHAWLQWKRQAAKPTPPVTTDTMGARATGWTCVPVFV